MEEFIKFIVDFANEEFYGYMDTDAEMYFLNGGCYEFAKILKAYIDDAKIVIGKSHCAILCGNGKIYDATGIVNNKEDYEIATIEDMKFMNEYYGIPEKQFLYGKKISDYFIEMIGQCNIEDIIEKANKESVGEQKIEDEEER